jgi:hypothetical protein
MSAGNCGCPTRGMFRLAERVAQTPESQQSPRSFHRAGFLRGVSPCEQAAFGNLQPVL